MKTPRGRKVTQWHAQVRVSSGYQDLRLIHLDASSDYVWSAAKLLVDHYRSTGCQAKLSRWKTIWIDTCGPEEEMEKTLCAGDELPF